MSTAINPQTIDSIAHIVHKNKYTKVVLQMDKSMLPHSFNLTAELRKRCPQDVEFFVLYDSLKKSCCTDILGAKHIGYDAIFHFGHACFSEQYQENHHYIFDEDKKWEGIEKRI